MNDSVFSHNRDFLGNLISENNEIGIIVGDPHSLDKIAAGLALYLSLKQIGKDVQIISRREPIVEYSDLFGIDKLKREFSGLTKTLTISLPYNEGEIEKVSYKIEGNKLNINLFSGDKKISFSENEIEYLRKGAIPSLVFVVSVSDPEKLTSYFDPRGIDVKLVNIDNSQQNDSYGDVAYVNTFFSSLSEIVSGMIQSLSLPIDNDISQNLLDGVSSSTDNYTSLSTSPFAFEAASFLMKNGAKRKQLQEKKFERKASSFTPLSSRSTDNVSNSNKEESDSESSDSVPKDWFTPKIYKSTSKKQE